MANVFHSEKILITKSKIPKAGRGVFARSNLKAKEIIEVCPVVVFSGADVPLLKRTHLKDYFFIWHQPKKVATKIAVCLGFGSLYNHSYEPNATYKKKFKGNTIEFVTLRNIRKGEEITVNYNYGKPDDKTRLWIKKIKPHE